MTRAKFWGRKLLLADSLNSETVRNVMGAAQPEIVSKTETDGVILIGFTDGSFLRTRPVFGTGMGMIEWTE